MTTNGNVAATKGYFFEDLAVGMEASYAKKITNDDVLAFADLSGDTNPVHLDEAYAAGTIFKHRIAHGFLTASLFSTVLGTKLPGPGCIYLSQSLKFRAPVLIGDEVVATAKVTSLDAEKGRAVLATQAAVNGKSVLDGEAVMMVPRRERAWPRSTGAGDGALRAYRSHGHLGRANGCRHRLAGRAYAGKRRGACHWQFRRRPSRPSGGARARARPWQGNRQTLGCGGVRAAPARIFRPGPALLPAHPAAGEARIARRHWARRNLHHRLRRGAVRPDGGEVRNRSGRQGARCVASRGRIRFHLWQRSHRHAGRAEIARRQARLSRRHRRAGDE